MKQQLLFLVCWMCLGSTYGQFADLPQTSNLNVIPPAPEAASLIRFVDYPVSYCTGIPEISVPVYTVKSRELSFPVALTYHASGIKVQDVSGSVGLGWALEAGGVVSKVVHGEEDVAARDFDMKDEVSVRNANNYLYLKKVMNRSKEANLDRYYYHFCGISGSFVIQRDGTIVQIPDSDNKIEQIAKLSTSPFTKDQDFRITTPDGTAYYFRDKEFIYPDGQEESVSSWYLNKIVSFNRTDSIEFIYTTYADWRKEIKSTVQQASILYQHGVNPVPSYRTVYNTYFNHYRNCQLLSEIRFNGNKLVFTYLSNRTDNGMKERLNEIRVYAGELLQTVSLNNASYFGDGRMKLSSVDIKDKNGKLTDQYTFQYINESSALTGEGYAQDMFGYYNGKNNLSLSYLDSQGEYNHTRDYSFSYASYYTLEKIKRITGGLTRFFYEANCHPKTYGTDLNIGIRIARIEDYESESRKIKTREFTYDLSTPTNRIEEDERYYCVQVGYFNGMVSDPYRQTNYYYPFSVTPGIPLEETRIYYGKVTENIRDAVTNETLKTVYEYDRNNFQNESGSAQYFPGYQADQIGANCPLPRFRLNLFSDYPVEANWAYNTLLKKTTYKIENNVETPVEVITHHYQKYNIRQIQTGLFVRGIIFMDNESTSLFDGPHDQVNDFYFLNVYVQTGCHKLKSTTTDRYFGTDKVSETVAYTYNSLDNPVRPGDNREVRVQTYTAGGKTYVRRYYYPADYSATPYTTMKNAHNINALVKEELQIEGTNTAVVQNNYSNFTVNGKSLIKVGSSVNSLNGTETNRLTIHLYDAYGNPACFSTSGAPKVCYIWGYQGTYPVAEIRNAEYTAVVNALGGASVLNAIGASSSLSQNDINKLNALRTSLPSAQVSVYTYRPLVGITSVTDASGRKISYEYDGMGRLQRVVDENGNPENEYEYLIKGH